MDAVIGGVLLSIGMVAVLSVGGQAMTMQRRGEVDVRAASAMDEILSGILTEGPVDYPDIHPMNGAFEFGSPYEDFQFSIEIEPSGAGIPALVRVTLVHETGREYVMETMIAEKRGEEPDPIRVPLEPIDREGRLAELEEQRNAQQPQQ